MRNTNKQLSVNDTLSLRSKIGYRCTLNLIVRCPIAMVSPVSHRLNIVSKIVLSALEFIQTWSAES